MLVLTRKPGQRVLIDVAGRRITLTLVRIAGERVRIGIDAPKEARILREELLAEEEGEDDGNR